MPVCKYGHTAGIAKNLMCAQCNRDRAKAWYYDNRDRALANVRAYQKAKPEKNKQACAKYRVVRRERKRISGAKWQTANPLARLVGEHRRRARKRAAGGQFTKADVLELLATQGGRCKWCGENVREKFHVDHIVPLSRGGSNGRLNICVSCPTCNIKKGAKLPSEFLMVAQGG